MSDVKANKFFEEKKKSILNSTDLSRKGNIDAYIASLIEFINNQEEYVTTSSCSGRIIVVRKDDGDCSKKGCKWIITSHEVVEPNNFVEVLSTCGQKNMILKFEPFILHVNCKDIDAAKRMQYCAFSAGYRNSGSVFGRNGSITFAIRGTLGMEVPLSDEEGLLVSSEYIRYLANKANDKMCENLRRIDSFSKAVYGMKSTEENNFTKSDWN